MRKKKNNASTNYTNDPEVMDDYITYVDDYPENFEDNSEVAQTKKLREKFITSEEDDALSENRSEDQEEQNEIHNNFFDNQPKIKKRDIIPPKL